MTIAKVLLRWYRSFNINYLGYGDRVAGADSRPWNYLQVPQEIGDQYRFIEIPIEPDITTVVGANESGKSHLLSAICKVITGQGVEEDDHYARTALCRYMSCPSKNAEVWPHIGVQFVPASKEELGKIITAGTGVTGAVDSISPVTLILAPDNKNTEAVLYVGNSSTPLPIDSNRLAEVRKLLPSVQFIHSNIEFADRMQIGALVSSYKPDNPDVPTFYDFPVAQEAGRLIESVNVGNTNRNLNEDQARKFDGIRKALSEARLRGSEKPQLELRLFRDILGIKLPVLELVAKAEDKDRGYVEGLVATWNREIDERLNLGHYWQQDDKFCLRLNYKEGVLFFEITDKTGAVYTFRERSSGLRYFLSYYIQAKALENAEWEGSRIILMDEPDSFLSILGQQNLLGVFESLVKVTSSRQNCQLIYSTHSPFLINRNFPRRIRLVSKGDAEEGTQFVEQARIRRYEPVRSALGIDCAQTLFMRAANVVLEGPVDQYLLSELIRLFSRPDNIDEFLDLNSTILVSAESAPAVEKLLAASQWADEPPPVVAVLLDNDVAGNMVRGRIIRKCNGVKALIAESFVLMISEQRGADGAGPCVTTEDIVPRRLYADAVREYLKRWYPDKWPERRSDIDKLLDADEWAGKGIAAGTEIVFGTFFSERHYGYDKLGVAQELVALLNKIMGNGSKRAELEKLEACVSALCHLLRQRLEESKRLQKRESGKQGIQRILHDFWLVHKRACSCTDLQILIGRLQREADSFGADGEILQRCLAGMAEEVTNLRREKQPNIAEKAWEAWRNRLYAIKKNPLHPESFDKVAPSLALEAKVPESAQP